MNRGFLNRGKYKRIGEQLIEQAERTNFDQVSLKMKNRITIYAFIFILLGVFLRFLQPRTKPILL